MLQLSPRGRGRRALVAAAGRWSGLRLVHLARPCQTIAILVQRWDAFSMPSLTQAVTRWTSQRPAGVRLMNCSCTMAQAVHLARDVPKLSDSSLLMPLACPVDKLLHVTGVHAVRLLRWRSPSGDARALISPPDRLLVVVIGAQRLDRPDTTDHIHGLTLMVS